MQLIIFLIFSFGVFLSVLLGGKKFRSTALYALAIGGVVNANFFHAGNYPIKIFGLPFGIDSIIYTLFVFCVMIMYIKEGKKPAYLLSFSSIIAIMFSALMQLVSDLLSKGSSTVVWSAFLNFTVSSIASIIAIVIMLEILNLIKNKNPYLIMALGIIIVSIINSCLYYPIATIIMGRPENILTLLLTSLIGKSIALICSIVTLYLINLYDKKTQPNTINKEKKYDNSFRN